MNSIKFQILIAFALITFPISAQKLESNNKEPILTPDVNKNTFEVYFRLNSGTWSSESLRREADANSSLGNAASNGLLTSYDKPSRDKKFENPGYTSLGFIYKNSPQKLALDYNYLVFSQYFKMNFKYAGVVGPQGMERSEAGSAFSFDIHPYRVENKLALTKEIFSNERFKLGFGGGLRSISIIREKQYPNFIPEYVRFVSSVSDYSNIIRTVGPQISLRSELQFFSSAFLKLNLDYFYTQGNAKYSFETVNINSIFISKADNKMQFHGLDFNTELSYIFLNRIRLFFGYELIVSRSKYLGYNELNSSFDSQTVISSEVKKSEFTKDKIDSLQLWYFGAGFIF